MTVSNRTDDRVTLKKVAEEAKVSPAVVSRVLSGTESNIRISEQTRQRVLAVAQGLGYRPNPAASRLAAKRGFRLIGTIFPRYVLHVLDHYFYQTILFGMADFCQEIGYNIVLIFADLDSDEQGYRNVVQMPADGFILTTVREGDTFASNLHRDNIPFVHIGRWPESPIGDVKCVDVDNYAGARRAVEHLLELGHRRIGTITGQLGMAAGKDRLSGYEHALRTAGISGEEDWVVAGNFDEASGYEGMLRLLNSKPRPTAVFCASDAMAFGALHALAERGLRVPDDISIIGFDDVPQSNRILPALSTVRQPIFELGRTAAQLLIHQLRKEGARPQTCLTPELVMRETTTRPRE